MPATPVHHTSTEDVDWDGPANKKNVPVPVGTSIGNKVYAWRDPDGDADNKSSWKFVHHHVSNDGTPGAANVKGCITGIGVLNGGMGGTTIPGADRKGVWKHLAAHLIDAGLKEDSVPELKSARAAREVMNGGREVRTLTVSRVEVDAEVREAADGTQHFHFSGCASSTESPYEMWDCYGPYTEIIRAGAFGKTIAEKTDIFLLGYHKTDQPLAGFSNDTLRLTETKVVDPATGLMGLMVDADLDASDPDVQRLVAKIRSGLINKMSFAFTVVAQKWSPDWMQRDIIEVELYEVSVVTWPANPNTSAELLAREAMEVRDQVLEVVRAAVPNARLRAVQSSLREVREGKAISASTLDTLQQVLELIATADQAVDEAQPILASLMGVDNPDDQGCQCCEACPKSCDGACCESCSMSAADNDTDAVGAGPDSGPIDGDGSTQSNSAVIPLVVAQRQAEALRLRRERPATEVTAVTA